MRTTALLAGGAALAASALAMPHHSEQRDAYNAANPHREIFKRATTNNGQDANDKDYDFIVVGGGLAGLVVGSRLSEWSNQTVLVIEAGGDGSDVELNQKIPGYTYHHGIVATTDYGYGYSTVPQSGANNNRKVFPLGRGLGGSGAINGMFWCRASREEINAWSELNPNATQDWSWDGFNQYINKAESMTRPPQDTVNQFHIPIDDNAHGHNGPLQVGWSQYIYPITENWVPSWEAMGFQAKDLAAGNTHGVTITPSTIDAKTQSRSDARTFIQEDRPNLTVLTGHQVTKLLFNGTDANGTTVSGVQFMRYAGDDVKTARARKEVIVSAGSINSPKLLQLSGIGPEALLKQNGIEVVKDLPVGYNLQDHVSSTMNFNFNGDYDTWLKLANDKGLQDQALQEWQSQHTGLWTYINEAIGYISGSDLAGGDSGASDFVKNTKPSDVINRINDRHQYPDKVRNGLQQQLEIQNRWFTQDIGQFEIIMNPWGSSDKNIGFQVALQHPWSRGTVQIASNDPFTQPNIDPDYYGIDADLQIHAMAYDWVRRLAKSGPFGSLLTDETRPASNGADQNDYLRDQAGTEYHPLGTNAMLPEEDGGVVNTELKVYGFKNLRVVDASIMPLHLSAHLMAPTYGVAEKGSDIIKQAHVYVPPPPPPSTTSSTMSSTSSTQTSSTETPSSSAAAADPSADAAGANSNKSSDGGMSTGAKIGVGVGVGVGGALLLGVIAALLARRRKQEKAAADVQPRWLNHTAEAFDDHDQLQAPGGIDPDGRPVSTTGSLDTMATNDLRGSYHQPPFQRQY